MINKKHLQTKFLRFIIEKHASQAQQEPEEDLFDDDQDEFIPVRFGDAQELPEDEFEKPQQDEEDEIENLVMEYKKLKKQYENNRIRNRKKRKSL